MTADYRASAAHEKGKLPHEKGKISRKKRKSPHENRKLSHGRPKAKTPLEKRKPKAKTLLEKRRIKTAKATLLALLVFLTSLAVWQCAEGSQLQTSVLKTMSTSNEPLGFEQEGAASSTPNDPLGFEQEGFDFMQASETGGILWYQSSWNATQSRALLERELILRGWQLVSASTEQPLCFVYAPSATAAGGTLYAMLYATEQGCSIVIELL